MVVFGRHTGRATEIQKVQRLNHARELLQRFTHLPDAVSRMTKVSGISPRRAYPYPQQAQHLKQPLPVGDAKIAFTVKLSRKLVRGLRTFANRTGLSLSEIVSRALLAALLQRRRRG